VADIFDERRRGLEEDYFRRKDRESLQRLREHLSAGEPDAGATTLPCPRCPGRLHQETFEDVTIDRCDTCQGIWLDAGELEHIISQEKPSSHWLRAFWPGRTTE
jgi:hypothetical protein